MNTIMYKYRFVLLALLAALISLLAFSQFFGISLMESDAVSAILSHTKADLSGLIGVLSKPMDLYFVSASLNYRPMQSIIWWITLAFVGLDFTVFHSINFIFHAANTFLIFFVARKLIRDNSGLFSFMAAVLFALHPFHLHIVNFVSRLPELLVLFSLLSSLLLLMKFLETGGKKLFVLSVALCAIGVFSKGSGNLIPFVLFFYVFSFSKIQNFKNNLLHSLRFCVPYFTLILVYAIGMFTALGGLGGYKIALYSSPSFFAGFAIPLFFLKPLFHLLSLSFISLPPAGVILTQPIAVTYLILIIFFGFLAFLVRRFFRTKKQVPLFLTLWLTVFFMAVMGYGIFQHWYAYAFIAIFSILVAYYLAMHVNSFGSSNFSKLVVLLVSLFFISVVIYSPLLSPNPKFHEASLLSNSLFRQTFSHAESLPSNSRILLLNYPFITSFNNNDLALRDLLIDDRSVQAFLDFALPEKELEVRWFNKSILVLGNPKLKISFECKNCSCLIENKNRNELLLEVASPWKPFDSTRPIRIRPFQTDALQGQEFTFAKEDSANTYLFIFDGQIVHNLSLETICQ